jgi:Fe2+ or Zn2+ uptake regulation protein
MIINIKTKNSRQRNAILAVLYDHKNHPTVDEIFELVKHQFPRISLATVYRNIEQLVQMKKIIKLEGHGGPARFDGNSEKHYHGKCRHCGKIIDVFIKNDLREFISPENICAEMSIQYYQLDFFGVCTQCLSGDSKEKFANDEE